MKPLLVFFLLPALIGLVCALTLRTMKRASLAATLASPLVVYLCVKALDPRDVWGPLGSLLVAPLVIAVAVIAVLLCAGRARVRRQRTWNDADRSDGRGAGGALLVRR